MCGIAGVLNFRGGAPDPAVLRRMAGAMSHRGPDDEGFFTDRNVALGFRRLSIIDLSGGHQPMSSDCGRYTVVFNGEIYNYQDLRRALEKDHGVRFRTSSDTEAILYGYREWGTRALARFNGMFALALWDAQEQTLLLARDRLGKKPLYYANTADGICFGSEVKVLFQHPGVSAEVERDRIPTFLTYRYVPGEETLFKGIGCLPPATSVMLSARAGMGTPEKYWDYTFAEPSTLPRGEGSAASLREELRELLTDSVRLRMIADVPFGAFLSGGLDSSLIVALMTRMHPEPLKTFSIGFDTGMSELSQARLVARAFGTDHHEIEVGSQDLIDNIPRVLHARETPVTEASDIPIFLLSKQARTKVTVVLSGEGSDEILAGYPKYAFEHAVARRLGVVPSPVLRGAASVLPFRLRRLQLALETVAQGNRFERYASWFGAFDGKARQDLLAPGMRLPDGGLHRFSEELLRGKAFPSRVEEMLYLDTWHWLAANLLLRGDRMTMANSLELRCPFLDYRLVEFAAQKVPLDLKVRGLSGKWILKQMASSLLPPEIVKRRKWGFKVPTDEWFQGSLAPVLEDVLLSSRARARGYFDEGRLRALIEAHVSGRSNHDKQLWILFQLELWHLMFIDRVLAPTDSLGLAAGVNPSASRAASPVLSS